MPKTTMPMDPNAGPEPKKRKTVAKDGTRRGVGNLGKRYQNKRNLQNQITDLIKKHFPEDDIEEFDAVQMAALIAVRASKERPAFSSDGRPIVDEQGNPIHAPPDLDLSLRALALVSRYTHSPMSPKPYVADDDNNAEDDEVVAERRALFREVGEKLGFLDPPKDDDDD